MQQRYFLAHIVFWLLIMVLGTATIYPYYLDLRISFIDRAIFLPVWWAGTYLNWWVLMPRLLARNRLALYLFSLLATILLLTIIQRYLCLYWFYPWYLWDVRPDPADLRPFLPGKFIQFAAFIALPILSSIGIRFLWRWYRESYQARQLIAQQQEAELKYLKAQLNPHFLFNTLNNLYGLSLEQSPKVPKLLLQLSDLLSYSLYESRLDRVPLGKELQLIRDLIALESARYEDRMTVELQVDEEQISSLEIAPLLLMPLVENAFKHGVKESVTTVPIRIHLQKKAANLFFQVVNGVAAAYDSDEQESAGLGLQNLRRRLELLYPGQYTLTTERKGGVFVAQLNIKIDEKDEMPDR